MPCVSSNRGTSDTGVLYESSNKKLLDTVTPCILSNRKLSDTAMLYESSNTNRKMLEVNLFTWHPCCHSSLY